MHQIYKLELSNKMDDNMKDAKDEFYEKKMQMWKKREELLNSMSEKELRAFIKGYMLAEKMVFKQLNSMSGCECGCCQGG